MDSTLLAKKFNRLVLAWHRAHPYPMPWRNTHDPYRILVSEVMLQQTQVARVLPKYRAFLKQFPTLNSLASSELGDVIRAWQGLGYNRRARMLRDTARVIQQEYHGRFPSRYDELIKLPGVGRSTAGALLAFSFNSEAPMIDTNVRRILLRVFFRRKRKIPNDHELYLFASDIVPKGKAREWNYALLDIGREYCRSTTHNERCPLNELHGNYSPQLSKKKSAEPFVGSDRYWRGKVIRSLTRKDRIKKNQLDHILAGCTTKEKILTELLAEGMIVRDKDIYKLP